jgi:hypothetical protein
VRRSAKTLNVGGNVARVWALAKTVRVDIARQGKGGPCRTVRERNVAQAWVHVCFDHEQ